MTYYAEPGKVPYDEWFDKDYVNPLDTMPIATDDETYSSRHESTPDFEKGAEEVVTMHEKMYRMARAKYNPFAVGGSEDLGGGSEKFHEEGLTEL